MQVKQFLAGVRVLDLSRHFPGPLASQMLADMGAEVLKIEPPRGDELRAIGPPGPGGESAYYQALNAGKRVARLDLASPAGREALLELAAGADVLLESFRPGVMARRGLGYRVLRARNPGLIYCSLSGFGRHGPGRQRAGHDANYLALAGLLAGTGTAERPVAGDPPLADCAGALSAAIAILGALHGRARHGTGCELDLSLFDSLMPLMSFQLAALGAAGRVPEREAELLNGGAAYYGVYRTADRRFVTLGAIEPKFWRAFCLAAGRPDWVERQDEALPQRALRGELERLFATLTLEECRARFEPADCCFAPVLSLDQAVASEQVRARALVRRGPGGLLQALFPAYVDGEPPAPRPPLEEGAARWRERR